MTMLDVRNLRVSYKRVPAVHEVSFGVRPGSITAILGGNGNGKSTVLRAIAGLNKADAGSISFNGTDITHTPAHARVGLGLSLVPEGRRLFPKLTVERNLELGAYTRTDKAELAASLAYSYEMFPVLGERRAQLAGTLSGGEQQMLAICRGLMAKPRLLMLDEPSWGVAPKLVTRIFETVRTIRDHGVSILLVEQNVQRALGIADYAYVIQTGRVALEGAGSQLLGSDDIKRAYLGL
jgi:branched-chain amino acid transport system ATP-binding protein